MYHPSRVNFLLHIAREAVGRQSCSSAYGACAVPPGRLRCWGRVHAIAPHARTASCAAAYSARRSCFSAVYQRVATEAMYVCASFVCLRCVCVSFVPGFSCGVVRVAADADVVVVVVCWSVAGAGLCV
jgi:hypothetical protein